VMNGRERRGKESKREREKERTLLSKLHTGQVTLHSVFARANSHISTAVRNSGKFVCLKTGSFWRSLRKSRYICLQGIRKLLAWDGICIIETKSHELSKKKNLFRNG